MTRVSPPELFGSLRASIDDARVDYRFQAGPAFDITLSGQIAIARKSAFEIGLPIEIRFDTAIEAKVLILKEALARVTCPATADDTQRIIEMIKMAQTQHCGLLVDIDVGHAPKDDDPQHWYVTDVGVMLPNILV